MVGDAPAGPQGLVFDIDTFAVHDGPGIRMAVYLKGCPLSCRWCHSPESQLSSPELIFMRDRCAMCRACVAACPQDVHQLAGREHSISRSKCRACGACVRHCPQGALAIKGYEVSPGAVVARAVRMRPFFDRSGGGVTLTGGEPTQQVDFTEAVLRDCRSHGIHTAMETSGACSWQCLERLLNHVDLLLYDLKLMDDEQHRRLTGASNKQILENASRLSGRPVQFRVPLIPAMTDTEENLRAIYAFVRDVGLSSVSLLPYNSSAAAKYQWLDRPYEVKGEPQGPDQLQKFARLGRGMGLDVSLD